MKFSDFHRPTALVGRWFLNYPLLRAFFRFRFLIAPLPASRNIIACSRSDPKPKEFIDMRYLVRARLKPRCKAALQNAVETKQLGAGSVAEGEYLRNMADARHFPDGTIRWVEVCYCSTPLAEEQPYWEEYFELVKVQDAHARSNCRDENGTEPWACDHCDCTKRLEERLTKCGTPFLSQLHSRNALPG
jgi:hypothetical protein